MKIIWTPAGGYWHYAEVADDYGEEREKEPIITPTPQARDFARLMDKLKKRQAAQPFDAAAEWWKERQI